MAIGNSNMLRSDSALNFEQFLSKFGSEGSLDDAKETAGMEAMRSKLKDRDLAIQELESALAEARAKVAMVASQAEAQVEESRQALDEEREQAQAFQEQSARELVKVCSPRL